jgi:hypothetical protein
MNTPVIRASKPDSEWTSQRDSPNRGVVIRAKLLTVRPKKVISTSTISAEAMRWAAAP